MKTNIAVFFGCRSVEHEVSIISAVQAMRAVNKEKYDVTPVYVTKSGEMYTGNSLFKIENFKNIDNLLKACSKVYFIRSGESVMMKFENNSFFSKKKDVQIDVAFPIVHGTNCEDGTMSGFFEFLGVPYVGCDILSAAVGMNKAVFKDVMKSAGIPVVNGITFTSREYLSNKKELSEKITGKVGLPLIIKPVNLGSSVGISKVNDISELDEAIELAVSFTDNILAEHAVTSLREINCSVVGDTNDCIASVCEEPFMNDEILSYADKYLSNNKGGSKGMASLGRKIPADLSAEKSDEIKALSCKIFKAVGASGVIRIDFLLDTETDIVYVNEINTIPGSLSFYLWEATDVSYTQLIDKLVEFAFKRQRNRENLTYSIDTNILSGVSFGAKGTKGAKL